MNFNYSDVVQHYNKILNLDIWSEMTSHWRTDRFCQFDFGRRIHRATLERALTLLPSRRLPLDRFKARRLLAPYLRLIEKQNDLNVFQIGKNQQTNKQTTIIIIFI